MRFKIMGSCSKGNDYLVKCLELKSKKEVSSLERLKDFINFIRLLSNDEYRVYMVVSLDSQSSSVVFAISKLRGSDNHEKLKYMVESMQKALDDVSNGALVLKDIGCNKVFFLK
ncbi:MAG: hypothetical protein B6U85_06800 [Desulfurococcales archaeon ex4484_42]|nr:MAG: hypothetical protein B6U85_06800 [Desulfurococcales archaeon ex4484_42]